MRAARVGLRLWTRKPWSLSEPGNVHFERNGSASWRRAFQVVSARADGDAAQPDPVVSPTETSSPEVQRIHQEMLETMKGLCIPKSALVSSILQQCSTPGDINLALEAISQLRTTRAVQGQQQANFSENLSKLVVNACLKVKDPENALKTLWTHNIYGFSPCLEAAHQILAYAREQHDLPLMQKTLKTMVSNSLSPTRTTADIALRICKDQGNEDLLFAMANEFHRSGIRFRPALYDLCIATAANAGAVKHVNEILKWRSKFKLPSTTASTFAMSKAHLLKGRSKDAAELIHSNVQESEERDMYLRVLVRSWPAEVLSRRKRSTNEATLKTSVEAMFEELQALGCLTATDATEFGAGKKTVSKVVY